MSIRPNTEVKLDTLAVQASKVVLRDQIKTRETRIKFTDDRQDYSTDIKLATLNTTLAVNGTEFTIRVYNGFDTIDVLEGCVHVKPHQGKTGKKICTGSTATAYINGTIE